MRPPRECVNLTPKSTAACPTGPSPKEEWKGIGVRRHSKLRREPERSVLCSERIVLECRCGERLLLLGLEGDWYLEGHITFECECGERLTLADRLDEAALAVE